MSREPWTAAVLWDFLIKKVFSKYNIIFFFRAALQEPEPRHLLFKGAKTKATRGRHSAATSYPGGRGLHKGTNSDAMFMGQLLRPVGLSLCISTQTESLLSTSD